MRGTDILGVYDIYISYTQFYPVVFVFSVSEFDVFVFDEIVFDLFVEQEGEGNRYIGGL